MFYFGIYTVVMSRLGEISAKFHINVTCFEHWTKCGQKDMGYEKWILMEWVIKVS